MSDSTIDVAQSFVRAINRHDAATLAELISPGHRFTDSLCNVVVDWEKMHAGWPRIFAWFPITRSSSMSSMERRNGGDAGWAPGTYSGNESLKEENRWRTPAAIRVMVDDGMITDWQVYADNEPIREQMRNNQ